MKWPILFLLTSLSFCQTIRPSAVQTGSINNVQLVDGLRIPTLSSAVTACASHPCVIHDNHPETTNSNPLAGLVAGSEVYLGPDAQGNGTWLTTAQWIVPNKVRLHLGGARNTGIQAVAGFPANTPLIQLGPTSGLAFGTSIEDGVINCNGLATIGVYSNSINEQSGGEKLDIINCPTGGFQFEGTGVGQSAGNFYWHDIEVYPSTFGTASTYAGKIDGFALNNAQIGMMYNITFVGNSGALSTSAFIFEGLAGGAVASLHCEQAVTCYVLGDATSPVNAGTFIRLECGSAGITTCVSINASGGNINLLNVANLGGATNTLVDNIQGKTITASHIGFYMVGVASMISSDPGVTSTLGALNVSNSLAAQERTALGAGTSGATLCYADSTAHALKCSYNNDAFNVVPRIGAVSHGIQHQRFSGVLGGTCPTAAAIGAACTSGNLNWTTAFADNSYTVTCSLMGSMTGQPHIVSLAQQAAGAGITITIAADTAAAANVAAAGFVDCIAVHD